ncbi:MAG: hypothetical protein HYW24_01525 [Candidatus Aenigmarchaeota archaeon]|nr:hypothetical protein [Candidatus Aenigmarchaeota archaeon]
MAVDVTTLEKDLYPRIDFSDVRHLASEHIVKPIANGVKTVTDYLGRFTRKGVEVYNYLTRWVTYKPTRQREEIGGTYENGNHRIELNTHHLLGDGYRGFGEQAAIHEAGHAGMEATGANQIYTQAAREYYADVFSERYGEKFRELGSEVGMYIANRMLEGLTSAMTEEASDSPSLDAYVPERYAAYNVINRVGRESAFSPTMEDAKRIVPMYVEELTKISYRDSLYSE